MRDLTWFVALALCGVAFELGARMPRGKSAAAPHVCNLPEEATDWRIDVPWDPPPVPEPECCSQWGTEYYLPQEAAYGSGARPAPREEGREDTEYVFWMTDPNHGTCRSTVNTSRLVGMDGESYALFYCEDGSTMRKVWR